MIRPRKRYQSSWIITFKTGYVNWSTFKENQNLVSLPKNSILLTADVVGVYRSIPHESGLQALEEALENRNHKQIFEFNKVVFQKMSGTQLGQKFASPWACIFMDEIKTKFSRTRSHQRMVWFRYIHLSFFIWIYGEEKLMADLMLLIPIFNSRMSPFKIFKHQFHKMTKHTQRIRR